MSSGFMDDWELGILALILPAIQVLIPSKQIPHVLWLPILDTGKGMWTISGSFLRPSHVSDDLSDTSTGYKVNCTPLYTTSLS